jgi:hypothetical protein
LLLVPWSSFWEGNYFVQTIPLLASAVGNNFVRGAVSGLGLVNIGLGLSDLFGLLSARRSYDPLPMFPHQRVDQSADLRSSDSH